MRDAIKKCEDELKELQLKLYRSQPAQEEDGHTTTQPTKPTNPPQYSLYSRKEFKVCGQIGNPGQRDKLSFMSLIHQIENALQKGYPEWEIVEGVVKAVTPGLQLRSYLEGREDLTLPVLKRLLRAHFQERSATELYQELCNVSQGTQESPQSFLLRALSLKQGVLFASDKKFRYEKPLVDAMFVQSVCTGLTDMDIRQEMKPLLMTENLSDEDLLEKLNQVVCREAERVKKARQKKHQISAADVTIDQDTVPEKADDKKDKNKGNSLYDEVQVLKVQVAEIHKALPSG